MSRPTYESIGLRTKGISFWVDEVDLRAIDTTARRLGMARSATIRMALAYLRDEVKLVDIDEVARRNGGLEEIDVRMRRDTERELAEIRRSIAQRWQIGPYDGPDA